MGGPPIVKTLSTPVIAARRRSVSGADTWRFLCESGSALFYHALQNGTVPDTLKLYIVPAGTSQNILIKKLVAL